ncbi:MAG: adenylate kinase [Acutalibacteraceae bacterium]|jgi:adenylate kinase|nr:adenylate kinase [Acutalibacteraceae bacterium]
MKIIFLGAPGAGKGTQAERVADALSIPTVSTGNIIREALSNGTEMGIKAKTYIEAGKLVPDDVVIGIIQERLAKDDCQNGFILDGFPRTIPQAEALEDMGIDIDKVVDIEVPDEAIKERMGGRRVCPKCGSTYHLVTKKPQKDGICDRCGAELVQRKDDAPETVADRLKVYHDQTEPLKDFYDKRGKLSTVDGVGSVEEIAERVKAALEA